MLLILPKIGSRRWQSKLGAIADQRIDRHLTVEGFSIRRGLRVAGFLSMNSSMLIGLGSDRRPGYLNAVILQFRLATQLSGPSPFSLRIVAPNGFQFSSDCQADVPSGSSLPEHALWSDALGSCQGIGQIATLRVSRGLKYIRECLQGGIPPLRICCGGGGYPPSPLEFQLLLRRIEGGTPPDDDDDDDGEL